MKTEFLINLLKEKEINYYYLDEDNSIINFNKNGLYFIINDLGKSYTLLINKNIDIKVFEFNNSFNQKEDNNITVDKNSKVEFIKICNLQNSSINTNTILKENSYINIYNLNFIKNTDKSFLNYESSHVEKDSSIFEYNVYLSNSNLIITNLCKHFKENTNSNITNLVIAKNDVSVEITTDALIIKGAKNSSVNQKTKGLLASTNSLVKANPFLHIEEFDCLASHGAGVGCLDPDEVFYLMSRGLSSDESKNLIIEGFINPIYNSLKTIDKEIVEFIINYIKNNI